MARGYDWPVLARRILAVYETVVPPGGAAVRALEDDALPGDGATRTPRRWGSDR